MCFFFHTKNIIVSYGSTACTNRFFCNKNATVILLANEHYKNQYEPNDNLHIISHLFFCDIQHVILNFDNEINENNIHSIFNLIK